MFYFAAMSPLLSGFSTKLSIVFDTTMVVLFAESALPSHSRVIGPPTDQLNEFHVNVCIASLPSRNYVPFLFATLPGVTLP